MKKRNFLSYLLVLAMITAMLTACGKEAETLETSETTETVETMEAVEPETITETPATETVTEETVTEETEQATELSDLDNDSSITGDIGTAAEIEESKTTEPEAVTEVEESKTKELESETKIDNVETEPESVATNSDNAEPEPVTANVDNTVTEPVAAEPVVLPGENRNGRYADVPESVLPASEAQYMSFYDEPIMATCWIDGVKGTIYADYARTQIIKEVVYDVDGYNDVLYVIGVGDKDCRGTALAIYNGQYVIINEALFDFWHNGKSSAFD